MIEINQFSVQAGEVKIIESLSTSFSNNSINGVFGLNGIGKSTLFNCMYGLLKYSGDIRLQEKTICKTDIAYLTSENYFYPNLLANEYLKIFSNNANVANFNTEKLAELLAVPLNKKIDTFSTGMKKKLAFLAVLKLNRPIFLLDEPFNGVDEQSVEIMKQIISKLVSDKKIIILTAHNQQHLTDLCDFVFVMERNFLYKNMPVEDFKLYFKNIQCQIAQSVRDAMID